MLEAPEGFTKEKHTGTRSPYEPSKIPEVYSKQEEKDRKTADDVLNQLNDIPELTKDQKERMLQRTKEYVSDFGSYLSEVLNKSIPLEHRKKFAEKIKNELFDSDGTITIVNRSGHGFTDKSFKVDKFFDYIINNNISSDFLDNYGFLNVKFYEGQFIKHTINMGPFGEDVFYTRKISKMFLSPNDECNNSIKRPGNNPEIFISGTEDIK